QDQKETSIMHPASFISPSPRRVSLAKPTPPRPPHRPPGAPQLTPNLSSFPTSSTHSLTHPNITVSQRSRPISIISERSGPTQQRSILIPSPPNISHAPRTVHNPHTLPVDPPLSPAEIHSISTSPETV